MKKIRISDLRILQEGKQGFLDCWDVLSTLHSLIDEVESKLPTTAQTPRSSKGEVFYDKTMGRRVDR